jgi:hypothetical protein
LPQEQHEEFMLFCCCVHGKPAATQIGKLEEWADLMRDMWPTQSLFTIIRSLDDGELIASMQQVRLGQYKRISQMWRGLVQLQKPCTIEGLMSVPFIGPKTAHFIMLYTTGGDYPVIDRHVLRWMSRRYKVPASPPPDLARYAEIANLFRFEAKAHGMTVGELDKEIWTAAATRRKM